LQSPCSFSSRSSFQSIIIVIIITGEPSKVSGHSDEVIGNIKSTVGGLTGNNELKAKGDAQHTAGTGQVEAATAKQKADAAAQGGKGNVKDVVGGLIGNDKMKAEGKADQAAGAAKGNSA
jgi:uncharacterized protein YjbJ (UPF0337 family)